MTLDQLRIFVAVAELEHVTRAAERLNLTQSATSAAIAALESQHNLLLFQRVGRGIELTAGGRQFLAEAKAVLARARAAELMLAELAGLKRGTLTIQASQTIAGYWLPARMVDFKRAYPGIEVDLTVGNTEQAAKAVTDGAVELGFLEGIVDDSELIQEIVGRDRLIIVTGAAQPWGRGETLAPADLAATGWVLREQGSGTRSVFETAVRNFGLNPAQLDVTLTLPSNESVRSAVEAGAGATAISEWVADPAIQSGALRRVPLELPSRAFYAIHHRGRKLSQAAEAFMRIAADRPAPPPRSVAAKAR